MGRKKGKKIKCPFCKSNLVAPENLGDILVCSEHGGTCEKTMYTITIVQPGYSDAFQEVFLSLYKALTGGDWGDPDLPSVTYKNTGFLLSHGKITSDLDYAADEGPLRSIGFVKFT